MWYQDFPKNVIHNWSQSIAAQNGAIAVKMRIMQQFALLSLKVEANYQSTISALSIEAKVLMIYANELKIVDEAQRAVGSFLQDVLNETNQLLKQLAMTNQDDIAALNIIEDVLKYLTGAINVQEFLQKMQETNCEELSNSLLDMFAAYFISLDLTLVIPRIPSRKSLQITQNQTTPSFAALMAPSASIMQRLHENDKFSLAAALIDPVATVELAKNNPGLAAQALRKVAQQINQEPIANSVKVRVNVQLLSLFTRKTKDPFAVIQALGLKDTNGGLKATDITQLDLSDFKPFAPLLDEVIKNLEQKQLARAGAHRLGSLAEVSANPLVFSAPQRRASSPTNTLPEPMAAPGSNLHLAQLERERRARKEAKKSAKPNPGNI